jgi:hypothetical protein
MSHSVTHTDDPATDDDAEGKPDQIEALKNAITQAQDLCMEFAIEMRKEAYRAYGEAERLSRKIEEYAAKRWKSRIDLLSAHRLDQVSALNNGRSCAQSSLLTPPG